MKQLEMIKAMAKLEGVNIEHETDSTVYSARLKVYNPIADLVLNCTLRDKYKVDVAYWLSSVGIDEKSGRGQASFENQSVGSAVIECILKSQGLWK